MSDRKYRQRGYQDTREEPQKKSGGGGGENRRAEDTFGPRPLQMPGTRTVSRCSQCGTVLQPATDPLANALSVVSSCIPASSALISIPPSRFECMQPIPERIARKDQRNECTFYSMRVTMEKETSTPTAGRGDDARKAFENLFKK